MDVDFDHTHSAPELGQHYCYSAEEDEILTDTDAYLDPLQDDCHMTEDPFYLRPEVDEDPQDGMGPGDLSISEFSTHLGDPMDYRFGAYHMVILDKLSATVIPDHPFQAADDLLATLGGSSQDPIYGNVVLQSSRYWESLQSTQSIPPGQSSGVCPRPTYLPSQPIPTSQLGGRAILPAEQPVIINPTPFIYVSRKDKLSRPPSCDHTSCYPPPDVGFLSRRFAENGNWLRGRTCAVASFSYKKCPFFSLPTEILEMIPKQFPVIDPLTSLGTKGIVLRLYYRHTAFRVLAATSRRLKFVFHKHSWDTRILTSAEVPIVAKFPKQFKVQILAPLVRNLITQLPNHSVEHLRECLLALPSLHTLEIVDTSWSVTGLFKSVFHKDKRDFPSIKKVTIPLTAHPILTRLPNVEELVCFRNSTGGNVNPIMNSLRGPYAKERSGEVEPVLKSLKVISMSSERTATLVRRLPRLRKLCLVEPTKEDIATLRGLKEIIELEILIIHDHSCLQHYDIDSIKPLAIEILQASECHKNCVCRFKCGCAETNECYECNPPKRFLRIGRCPHSSLRGIRELFVYEGVCLEKIQVSPQRIVSTK